MKKIILLIPIIILLCSLVSANPVTDYLSVWNFSNSVNNAINSSYDLTNGGATLNTTCGLPFTANCFYCDGSDHMKTNAQIILNGLSVFTVNSWAKFSTVNTDQLIGDRGGGGRDYSLFVEGAARLDFQLDTSGGVIEDHVSNFVVPTDVWIYTTWVYNGTHVLWYVNGTIQDTDAHGAGGTVDANGDQWAFCDDETSAIPMTGWVAETTVLNVVQTPAEILADYNNYLLNITFPFISTDPGNFTITATNFFYGETLNNFSAILNGVSFNTTTGTINTEILDNASILYNITVLRDRYLNRSYLNYNLSNNPLAAVLNSTFFRLNISVFQKTNNSLPLNNFSYNVFSDTDTILGNTTSGNVVLDVNQSENYTIIISSTDFVTTNRTILTNYWINHTTFYLFNANSISFFIRSLSDLTFINQTTNITMVGSTITFDFNTSNGSLYIYDLNPDTYRMSFISVNFSETILFATLGNSNHLDINVFLTTGTIEKAFIITDSTNGDLLPGVTLSFLQNINGTLVTIAQAITDFSGRATTFLDESEGYTILVSFSGYNTFSGQVQPTEDEYNIILEPEGAGQFITLFEDIVVATPFNYLANNTFALSSLVINSVLGSLQYYTLLTTYDGIDYSLNRTGFPGGSIETLNITNIEPNIENELTVKFFFKSTLRDNVEEWNVTYFLSEIQGTNISLANMFEDVEDIENPAIQALIGAFIMLVLVVGLGVLTREPTVMVGSGLLALGIIWRFTLWPTNLVIVCIIVCVVLLLADLISRGN